jgi:hypothetical protein
VLIFSVNQNRTFHIIKAKSGIFAKEAFAMVLLPPGINGEESGTSKSEL